LFIIGLASFIEVIRVMEVVVTTLALSGATVKSSPPTNQLPMFYRLDALPVAQPTV